MTAHGTLYGLVLAGGRSSRMGQDKSRMSWFGKPLYQHMASLLTQAGIDQVLISGSGFSINDSVIEDVVPGRGPVSGIHSALKRLHNGDRLLVIPVDMPLIPADAIRILGDQQRVCCFEGFNLPVVLPVTTELRQAVDTSIASDNPGDYALWRLYQRSGGQTIPLPLAMADLFVNANTPGDWCDLVNKEVVQK
ncbi:molybdenum cofactor guanylyltransferase [Endozoicomonas sp. SCSIO W0465]|uniref:molybdenum cofactor guanylyltransferase n=1 Tax=Endozoicomonas sp. SCSIO W0465 TaxID=2918516 RepID=UPI002075DC08|nr:molybdenum cofactor guanylyltransferase [Endozoicomonas sp. SCSIO W0465]USE37910.1 molybdenum cofactor guanylyltransferase [Endozoicomonas sp. SCSIO W0465]